MNMMIDAVGGFFGRRKDCIVVEGCVCEGDLFFFLVSCSCFSDTVNPVLCPFDA